MASINKQHVMNKKEVKEFLKHVDEQFGASFPEYLVYLKNEKHKISVINRDIEKIDLTKIRINSSGLYIAETKDGVRLSIEGSQLLGPKAAKNILELDDIQARNWLKGYDIEYHGDLRGFMIIRHKKDFLGCGKAVNEKILNFVPKARRIHAKD